MTFKSCDSNFEVKCSNFKYRYKWNIYLALNSMYLDNDSHCLIDFKHYPNTYCLMQGRWFICSDI